MMNDVYSNLINMEIIQLFLYNAAYFCCKGWHCTTEGIEHRLHWGQKITFRLHTSEKKMTSWSQSLHLRGEEVKLFHPNTQPLPCQASSSAILLFGHHKWPSTCWGKNSYKNVEVTWFMSYSAANHQGALQMFWLITSCLPTFRCPT